jgi:glycosyltransferase involved in cell wall biosynthesis
MSFKAKILIWTASYPPVLGGLQTVTQQLAQGLSNRGYEVIVLANRYPNDLPEFEITNNIKVFRVLHVRPKPTDYSMRAYAIYLKNKLQFQKSQKKIVKIIKDFNPEVINVHFPDPQIPYWEEVKKWVKCKLIVSTHGHEILKWFRQDHEIVLDTQKIINSLQQHIKTELTEFLANADAITACSGWMLQKTIDLIGPKHSNIKKFITYNAVDTNRFLSKAQSEVNVPYIFSFGRLAPHKGFSVLLEAFAQLQSTFPNMNLVIGGSGADLDRLKRKSKSLGISSKTIFAGRLSAKQIVAYTQTACINVIPSLREPFGISVIEALAANRPVVATKIGGIPEAAGGYAVLCEPTAKDLASNINLAIKQKLTEIQITARKNHLASFSLGTFLSEYEKVLMDK